MEFKDTQKCNWGRVWVKLECNSSIRCWLVSSVGIKIWMILRVEMKA